MNRDLKVVQLYEEGEGDTLEAERREYTQALWEGRRHLKETSMAEAHAIKVGLVIVKSATGS